VINDSTAVVPEIRPYIPSDKETVTVMFNGQGAWFEGMGEDLFEYPLGRKMYEEASRIADIPVEHLFLRGPKNSFTQLLATYIYGVTLEALRKQIEREDRKSGRNRTTVRILDAKIRAGHSAGELAALTGEAYTYREGINLVAKRGKLTEEQEYNGVCMMAVKTGDKEGLEEICIETDTHISLENTERLYAIGGEPQNIEMAQEAIRRKKKGKTRPINMLVALHTPLYKRIGHAFGDFLRGIGKKFRRPKRIVLANATGSPYESDIITPLERQVSERVKFVDLIRYILGQNPVIIEIGPGSAVSYFFRDMAPEVKIVPIRTGADLYNSSIEPYQARSDKE
jgi:malonyl CoA-acyl carrier protein transacylase